ncbi:hypothetical protein BBL91_09215 [Vibrio parahaemolyticus]|uniref:O-antigen polysaccharide polymerase Wzy n=3 Tax=Vibrio parahaemolyticus TaxID=670 RepID=A0A7M1WH45_VIBPH|nr:O-antigen polysaccharide polymerase Wzy [Vibrio parahaemolyticus]EHD6027931.1 O-antigen polysaccharide polymerase Wzy [Vibrio parahaemolyticus]EJR0956245.1 O-antigen polysaccharide polymerase Wzy [Vibrio parahaemolyticus]EKY4207079.1 O-antigen polysaccharide polymerase Wzy [Vibrio parahaemolyticus]KOE96797.1 hypothetical protein ACS88_01225 [Vibrio parahaemolyticus]MBE3948497.1 O-antigen polysaccharide polymerase Wzy [Vibrio parahaemolyticus]
MRNAHLIISLFSSILLISLTLFQMSGLELDFKDLELLIFILVTLNLVLMSTYRKDWSSLAYLFNLTFIVFLLSKPFVDLFGYQDALIINSLIIETFSEVKYNLILTYVAVSYSIINMGLVFLSDRVTFPIYDEKIFNLSKRVIIISTPLIIYKYYLEIIYLMNNGYLSLFTGGLRYVDYGNVIIANSHSIFIAGFFLLIASNPKLESSKWYLYIFLVVSLLDALKGARGLFVLPLLYYFWYVNAKKTTGISRKTKLKIIIVGFVLVISSQLAVDLRMKNSDYRVDIFDSIATFFYQQGNSLNVVYFSELYRDELNSNNKSVPFVLEPVIFPYLYVFHKDELSQGQTDEAVAIRPNLNHRLTYMLNPRYYINGGGLGSSYVAELAVMNLIYVIVGSLLIPIGIILLVKGLKYRMVLFLSYYLIAHILFLPRTSLIPNFWVLGKYCLFFIFLYYLSRFCFINGKVKFKSH